VFDATTADPYHRSLISGFLPYPKDHKKAPKLYQKKTRPLPAVALLSSDHFPDRFQGNLLVANVIGVRGILQYEILPDGSSYGARNLDPILSSADPNFRPVDMAIGPDGALYFCDWQNPVIGHMQHHVRDPSRDHEHGRVYRVTHKNRNLTPPKKIDGQPIPHLLDLLKSTDNHVRYRAKIELSERDRNRVLQGVDRWLKDLDENDPEYVHHLLEGLWVHRWNNKIDVPLLKRVLSFPDHRARAAAVKTLPDGRNQIGEPLKLLEEAVHDNHPLVRLEAVRALSFFRSARAAEIALQVLRHNMDQHLRYTLGETFRSLKPFIKTAIRDGKRFAADNAAGIRYTVSKLQSSSILDAALTPAMDRVLLTRPGIPFDRRRNALKHLAKAQDTSPLQLIDQFLRKDNVPPPATAALLRLVTVVEGEQPSGLADRIHTLAWTGDPAIRPSALAALVTLDGDVQRAQNMAVSSRSSARAFLKAIHLLNDSSLREKAYEPVRNLLFSSKWNTKRGAERDGLTLAYYEQVLDSARPSAFDPLTPTATTHANNVDLNIPIYRENTPDAFALSFEGVLRIKQAGTYTFHLTSDDGSLLMIDGDPVVDNDGLHAAQKIERLHTPEPRPASVPADVFRPRGKRSPVTRLDPARRRETISPSRRRVPPSRGAGSSYGRPSPPRTLDGP